MPLGSPFRAKANVLFSLGICLSLYHSLLLYLVLGIVVCYFYSSFKFAISVGATSYSFILASYIILCDISFI